MYVHELKAIVLSLGRLLSLANAGTYTTIKLELSKEGHYLLLERIDAWNDPLQGKWLLALKKFDKTILLQEAGDTCGKACTSFLWLLGEQHAAEEIFPADT